ncbi:response regulator [Desulfopila aestuarii]|uniref:DNA-binding response regulator, NarL/FixJ family, contains REC and HTH domains n=1 Tax=Desulfopila aestuarii DSM 18488 TaxID=1121416 RepID=A0A1M7Y950_9BACT|nr:response regulator transcription factor [Desulfopila aestuarii]SHO49147.1 DNA-binding response regulator, NarL/FixJ family, contains REC and HTH domains [Desulfopila aestuarii DSM 18488]
MLKILTADDHAVVRAGVRQILSESKDMRGVVEAETGAEAVRQAALGHFDVILLDVSLPDKNGLEVLKMLRQQNPDQAVLMLSMHPEEQYAIRALKAGARGYLTKESAPAELVSAVRKVSKGGRYISLAMAEKLAFYLDQDQQLMPHQLLSDREYQVMLMIAGGKTVSEIADELGLSVKTISTNRVRAMQKMAMRHNAEFTYYAVKEGLVS